MANNPHAAWNVTTRDWRAPAGVVLDNVLQLYRSGELDRAVANRPDLKRFTDALVAAGHMTIEAGRLVPKVDESGWFKPAAAHVPDPNVSAPPTQETKGKVPYALRNTVPGFPGGPVWPPK